MSHMAIDLNLSRLRCLDIEDMIVMSLLKHHKGVTAVAKEVNLTPPAICHKLVKMQSIFGKDIFNFNHYGKRDGLTDKGQLISEKCTEALAELAASLT